MGAQPLVSVIIPTYNAERWIRETLDSVLAQEYAPIEIVVVDDCSTDRTRELLASFGKRIRVIENMANQGVSAARNIAIKASLGDYVAFIDHDDLWHPQKLQKQMRLFMDRSELGLVYSDAYYETAALKRWRSFEVDPPFRGQVFEKLLQHNFILCLTAVIPRAVLEKTGSFNPIFRFVEDYDLFLRIAERFPVDFIEEPLATYRVHDQNFSRRLDVCYTELIQLLATHRAHAGVQVSIALTYLDWGKDIWRRDRRPFKGLLKALKGLFLGLGDLKGFLKALRRLYLRRLYKSTY